MGEKHSVHPGKKMCRAVGEQQLGKEALDVCVLVTIGDLFGGSELCKTGAKLHPSFSMPVHVTTVLHLHLELGSPHCPPRERAKRHAFEEKESKQALDTFLDR